MPEHVDLNQELYVSSAVGSDHVAETTVRNLVGRLADDASIIAYLHLKLEDMLIEMRDSRMFVIKANGLVAREKDGSESSIMRIGTADAVRLAFKFLAEADDAKLASIRQELEALQQCSEKELSES